MAYTNSNEAAHNPAQYTSEQAENLPQTTLTRNEETPVLQGFAVGCDSVRILGMDDIGPELLRDAKAETAFSIGSAAPALHSGRFEGGLNRLAELWPMLSELDRLALVDHAEHLVALRGGDEAVLDTVTAAARCHAGSGE